MRSNTFKSILIKSGLAASVLLLAGGAAFGQQQINLTAAPATANMPDGSAVPMWGYSCGAAVGTSTAKCAPLNTAATGWSPVVITVPTGQTLQINLTNNLAFMNGNLVPTSLVIVGQLGGGLGTPGAGCPSGQTCTDSPDHSNAQPVTWPISPDGPGNGLTGVGTPPAQGKRVQSFSTEVQAALVINNSTANSASLTWTTPRPGTYLLESGTHPSIQGPMGLYGIVVVTAAPAAGAAGTAYPGVTYNAELPLLLSEIDPVQNSAVSMAVNTSGFTETAVWSGQPSGCGNPASPIFGTCYPPTVNYSPLYYMINGVAFDKSHASNSVFAASPTSGVTGNVLVRFVNAGLRMHVPSIVGASTGAAAVPGFSLIAEDGNPLPGLARVQNEVFMAAGKTYDVMVNVPAAGATALPIYDRELSLSGNSIARDAGMLAYVSVNGAAAPSAPALGAAVAVNDSYPSLLATGQTLTVSDASKGLIANDSNVYGVQLLAPPANGTVTLNANGTFTYVPTGTATSDSFTYCANGIVTAGVCSSGITAKVTLGAANVELASGIKVADDSYANSTGPSPTQAARLLVAPPGVLANDSDAAGYPLSVDLTTVTAPAAGATISMNADGSFSATATAAGTYTFTYKAKNSQGTTSTLAATVQVTFPAGTGLAVTVLDGKDVLAAQQGTITQAQINTISDYRWVIEEDRTFYIDPACTTNPPPVGCPSSSAGIVPTFGTNFHTSYMPVVATGCTGPLSCESGQTIYDPASGSHINAVCDIGNGVCRADPNTDPATGLGLGETPSFPSQVKLDPTKRYYISILPGDAATPFENANLSADCTNGFAAASSPGTCGHGMGGAPIKANCSPAGSAACATASFPAVTILTEPAPYPPSKLSVFVFEDDFPLNGEQDGGGGIDVLSPNEPGLGGFNITLFDDAGGTGDATGQMTYDMFNQPLVNSLAGQLDPANHQDACPISKNARIGKNDPTQTGITGTIITCPKYEADGVTLSPLAGQAVVANLMPGRYGVVATPAADRIGRGEEWLQTNTLDGQKAHDSFLRIGEPSFFQEFGPAGYHVSIGFANPAIINGRKANVCAGTDPFIETATNCTNSITGTITTERMSRTPDQRLYSSGDNSSFAFTQCYVSFGDSDGEDFAFTKCDENGQFTLTGLPDGTWRVTVFDQWNDMLVDGLSTPVRLAGGKLVDMGQIAMNQWQANIITNTFFDQNGNGVRDSNEPGLTLVPTNIRFRDGSYSNFNNTDLNGNAGFNEEFPLFSWYVVETDSLRFKNTGTHVVYDAGGPTDGSANCGTNDGSNTSGANAPCGNSNIAHLMANTAEQIPVPTALRVPGARYCKNADCPTGDTAGGSTGRVDPAWVTSEGWQGFSGQNSFIEFGKMPFAAGETGGIHGEVIYASTRPFDDPAFLIHTSWTPDVPGVTINLYQETTLADGSTSLKLVDTTKTSSWDDWAQGFRSDGNPNMSCPGQGKDTGINADLFFFTLFNQPNYLDLYNNQHNGTALHTVPNNSQFKCYDGLHTFNQVQPAPYDGMYQFPSVTARNPTTGVQRLADTNCTVCVANPTDGTPMLPKGKYVVEMITPPGYELVKEEDKNILIGDNYIAPVTQQFPGLGSAIYIMPDQAQVSAAYNANNAQNSTNAFGRTTLPNHEGDTGSVETFWPCVGASRIVPDYISLYPQSLEVAPFAGAMRNLCDRKEVTLDDQTSVLAKFWVFTSAHVAAHFTGVITDDYTSEFDPFSPQFGEKFSPANLPVALKDWTGTEISRVYADQWGTYNGLTYSTWEVNPPNPTGYAPTMMVTCMNDPGTGAVPDPLYNPEYSQFCYEIPFMPGQTQYMDTPVVPTSAFAGAGYNNPDCNYPDATPAVSEVDGDGVGPYVSASGHTLTIYALGTVPVANYNYSGPAATIAPFNQKTSTRKYSFGSTAGTVALLDASGTAHPLTGVTWGDLVITGSVPTGLSNCPIEQQSFYSGSTAQCGQLVITAANGKQSVDTVTVTIGGKAPTHVSPTGSVQNVIDAAYPGDMIMIDPLTRATTAAAAVPSNHQELLIMWKPVRLQGVGAASSIINANTHPAGKIDVWRREINCLFGLALDGVPITPSHPYDPTNTYVCPVAPRNPSNNLVTAKFSNTPTSFRFFTGTPVNPQIDRLPLEATVGWDATLNGNLAELLQEPTLMGALEGATITVLSKGVHFPNGSNPFGADTFPTGTVLLTGSTNNTTGCAASTARNPFPSSFWCNPSSIDGLSVTNSSQGGGGIFVHGWGHNLQIANNRVMNNAGTLSGGINIGQGEHPDAYLVGADNADPGSCVTTGAINQQLPYCFVEHVNVHHNFITDNSSTGDELFSATPAGAGGISFCTGADYYKFNYNWVCGNLSSGDGGGLGHLGFIFDGDIEHNTFLFNQSTNPTIPTNGGAILAMGAPDVDPTCGDNTDIDCVSVPPVGPSDGTGPNLVINANLIMGNAAESGSGGGIRLQAVNGSEVVSFPRTPSLWNSVSVTNNIITNNVAGWDGAGISLQDALNVNIVNDTIMSNDTTASSGVLFDTLGAPLASSLGTNCIQPGGNTSSCPQPAGLVSIQNSSNLTGALAGITVTCPAGHYAGTTATNGSCRRVSYPELYNDVFWQNRAFYIGVGSLGLGTLNQQNVVAMYEAFTSTRAPSQPAADATTANGAGVLITGGTGACTPAANAPNYWDIGVRGDTGPNNHSSSTTLAPTYSVITDIADYAAAALHNTGSNPHVLSQYCNGSRVPPENGGLGYDVPPGISDATVPNPIFNLTPAATVDEGNNWINISWGPLSLSNPSGVTLGNYGPSAGSPVINYIPSSAPTYAAAPATDFYGTQRKTNNFVDAGAVEFTGGTTAPTLTATVSPGPLAFGNWATGTTSNVRNLTVTNTGTGALAGGSFTFGGGTPQPFARAGGAAAGTCGATLAVGASCSIGVTFSPGTATTFSRTLTVAYTGATVTGSPVTLTGTGVTGRAAVAISAPTITLATGVASGTGLVTMKNNAAAGGSQVSVTGVAASGGTILTFLFSNGVLAGPDNCTGTAIAPGASCTVSVRFTNLGSARGANRAGTITFTDTGVPLAPSTTGQSAGLVGFATP